MSSFIQQKKIVLASGSINRKKMLESIGLQFITHPADLDEQLIKTQNPDLSFPELALLLAQKKAKAVSAIHPCEYIIGADQLCVLENEIFDKPLNNQNASHQLHRLSGKCHQLFTAVCIAQNNQIVWEDLVMVNLQMRTLSNETIEKYLRIETPYQSCGSYHFEGWGKWLFKDASTDESTIIGLALTPLLNALINLDVVQFA